MFNRPMYDKMWMSDPGAEPIILDKVETKMYCSTCKMEMVGHGGSFECPICHQKYKE